MTRAEGYAAIGDYGVISDQRTAALVCADGSIDWMCGPRFDDPPLFGTLLDPARAGAATLRPSEPFRLESRTYVEDTNVLQTTWRTDSGLVEVTDAMVVSEPIQRFSQLLRRVRCLQGEVELDWEVRPRVGWDAAVPAQRAVDNGHVLTHGDIGMLVQAFGLGEARGEGTGVQGSVRLRDGDSGMLSALFTHAFPLLASDRDQCERRLEDTIGFWRAWLRPLRYDGPWAEAVRRSTLALGACVHDQTGALVAAPTTSLPEEVGGERNYDYRYCWVRDTSFALDAALRLGMTQFAQATLGWLLRSQARTHPRVNVFFTLDGDTHRDQHDLDLPGYRASRPVRSGNSAGDQRQLGSYGDLMETAWLFVRSGSHLDRGASQRLAEVADHVCAIWRDRDAGIWELGDCRDYTFSKVACWTALDRACRLAGAGQLERAEPARWEACKTEIARWIRTHCIDREGVLLRDGNGSGELDCAVLLTARSDLLDPTSAPFSATIDRLGAELGAGGGLLYRYSGMADEENAFLPCSFWMVEALSRAGRLDEAGELMDGLVDMGNDLGLVSEEIDPSDGSLVGNFPQALSHLAVINAAAAHAAASDDGEDASSR